MTIQEIADRLVALNKAQDHQTAYAELYVDDVVSVENWGTRDEFVGMDAIVAKGEKWEAMVDEIHDLQVGVPIVADHSFAVTFTMDVTFNASQGPEMAGRMQFTELAVYRVNEAGKIYHEEFIA